VVLLLNLNNAQKHSVHIFDTLTDTSSNYFVLQLPTIKFIEMLTWAIVRTQARRCFLHSSTAVSIMFCSTLI